MALSDRQKGLLRQPLDMTTKVFRFPDNAGKDLAGKPYMPTHISVETANEIFEFDWASELLAFGLVFEREEERPGRNPGEPPRPVVVVCYWCRVKVTAAGIVHEAIGVCTNEAGVTRRGDAHEVALMGAESTAKKRALYNFGQQFGSHLRDKADPEGFTTSERMSAACNGAAPAPAPAPAPVAHVSTPTVQDSPTTEAPAAPPQQVAPAASGKLSLTPEQEAILATLTAFKQKHNRLPRFAEQRGVRGPKALAALTSEQISELSQAVAAEEAELANA